MLKFYRTRMTLVMLGLIAYGIAAVLYFTLLIVQQTACTINPNLCDSQELIYKD